MTSRHFPSPLPAIDIPLVPLTQYVLGKVAEMPDRPAIIDGPSGRTLSFQALSDAIHRLAGGLQASGFKAGDTLALVAPNIPEYAVVFHAVAVCGGTVTTVNPTYGAEEINFQLNDAQASVCVTVPAFIETVSKAIEGSPVQRLLSIGASGEHRTIEALMGEPIAQVPVDVMTQTVALPYSSGTTGMPKGVMLSHHNLVANVMQTNQALIYESGESALAVLPFFHIYGMQVLMNSLLAAGVTVITMPRFDMEQALALIQQYKITQFFAVPPIVLGLAKHPLVDKYDISSLRKVFSGAAPLGAELAAEASARIGCPIAQGYGMTELSPVSHVTVGVDIKPGTNGVTVANTVSRLIDAEGNDVGVDEDGELLVKGPQVMLGYLNNEAATAATIDKDGWLHTGDVARIDADGHMTIVDRVKELIKVKGFQVAPAELEALIVTHPAVADVAVIGVDDAEAGELPKAFVVLKPEQSLTIEALQAFVASHLASYKQVRLVEFVDAIPKSASGKILRRELRARS